MRRIGGLALAFWGLAQVTVALPPYWETFSSTYSPKSGSNLAKARCSTCHVSMSGGTRNVYGRAVQQELGEGALTAELLRRIEPLDSDGDGISNGTEIEAGELPGDPTRPVVPARELAPDAPSEPIPKHSYHPLIVHFPVALFLFGALLEGIGFVKKRDDLRSVARWNLLVGAAAAWLSVPTGLIAAFRLGLPLEPGQTAFNHLLSSMMASVVMTLVALARLRGMPKSAGYLTLVALASLLLTVAAHFGGVLVYG